MQLLKITSTPIEYQYQIDRARLEIKNPQPPEAKMESRAAKLKMHSQNVNIRLDTKDMRSSIGLKSAPTLINEAAQKGVQTARETIGEMARFGDQLAQISTGTTVSSLIKQKILQQPTTQTVFLPSTGPVISWQPNDLQVQYEAGDLQTDWQIMRNVMDYVPGKFSMQILQYPKVNIEYLGEPNYVPPSANPNYEGE